MKKIVRGNDFTLRVPVMKIVNGEKVAFPLPGCTDIKVNVVNQYRRIALSYTIDVSEDNMLNGAAVWLDKATRVGLMNSTTIAKAIGQATTML